jgi:hypothetical protein
MKKFKNTYVKIPTHDVTDRLIEEAMGFSSPYLNKTVEFQDMKNHLISFYEEQRKRNSDPSYYIPNYTIVNVIMLSLRQLIIELLKEINPVQQINYLDRVVKWFYNK